MDGQSQDITEIQKTKLKELLPEIFNEGKIDFDKLKATLGDEVELGERYSFAWKGKNSVFQAIKERTSQTLKPAPQESVDWDTTKNLFIEGDNLEALKVLHKAYYGKVKMIYIDPPYNTGNDFVYNDKFAQTRNEYEAEAGLRDEAGNITRTDGLRKNSKDSGHYHSDWLTMIYPRLHLARNFLSQDGVIFVSIDDNEVHNLRMIMNEIFGEENFIAQFIWRSRLGKGSTSKQVATIHEYILCYARNYSQIALHTDVRTTETDSQERLRQWGQGDRREDRPTMYFGIETTEFGTIYPKKPDGSDGRWRASKEKVAELYKSGLLKFEKQNDGRIEVYRIIPKGSQTETAQSSVLDGTVVKTTAQGTKVLQDIVGRNIFDYAKPIELMKYLLSISTDKNDISFDFFSGSGTLAHAVGELNAEDGGSRQWICVQLPEETDEKSEAYKAGYKNIADIAKERIRRAGRKISEDHKNTIAERKTPLDLGFKVYKVSQSNFKAWNTDIENEEQLKQQMLDNLNPIVENASEQDLLTELLLKNGISPLEKIEKHTNFYLVPSCALAICLIPELTQEIFNTILGAKPKKLIILDKSLHHDDQLKANLLLQAEQAQIDVEVI